ncbi:hypothetical protein [Legionella waltersii]|uniref:Structural toxin protein (Hemagglutinin/hemolysin) RtxA n=1 Tax=Legionella waltersii TaxID=66969 RepID=A0A0W1ABQ9_9GAMM|nr:hypothetical protein [Legionella waltersii]KTD78761.1 structural toxin protein (hemagglutinin/hemolysin) RtxA [Legionella waltersii]SNV11269.1 structural toxin protein (hemagglutinin/hemolysin) RtxA [Legionella waltersii]
MYMLYFHVPETHLEIVKSAIFAAGAGCVDNYTNCSWQVLGQGQFMPQKGSTPFIGQESQLETVNEYKVETVCSDDKIRSIVAALKAAHPYESPSYQVIRIEEEY